LNRPKKPALILAGVAILVLSGCSSPATTTTGKDPDMDHVQASAELDEILKIAQDAIGGEWKNLDGGAAPCALPSGGQGVQYGFGRTGPGVPLDQQKAIEDLVVTEWTAREFAPVVGSQSLEDIVYTTVRYPETGYGVDGLYLDFRLGERGSAISGQTRCVPGDYRQINKDYQAERNSTLTPAPTP
jgi:hypothetical protein